MEATGFKVFLFCFVFVFCFFWFWERLPRTGTDEKHWFPTYVPLGDKKFKDESFLVVVGGREGRSVILSCGSGREGREERNPFFW